MPFPANGATISKKFAPILNNDPSVTCKGFITPNNVIREIAQGDDPTYNDIDGMPWFWYYRDKPLSSTNVLPLEFIPAGTLQYPEEQCLQRGLNCTLTCCLQLQCASDLS